jgi:hypothetical protein
MIQDAIIVVIVLLALGYLIRRWSRCVRATKCGENCCCDATKNTLAAKLSTRKPS